MLFPCNEKLELPVVILAGSYEWFQLTFYNEEVSSYYIIVGYPQEYFIQRYCQTKLKPPKSPISQDARCSQLPQHLMGDYSAVSELVPKC